jgi:hypothetical protein
MHLLYLNPCQPNGCDISPGPDDSRSGRSSIPTAPSHLEPWQWGDAKWQGFVSCMRDFYMPFDLEITLDDPGGATHFELIAAGRSNEVGVTGAAGIAPFIACDGLRDNAIAFVFANATDDLDALCWGGAQETGHIFGLDHALLAADPMTYLPPAKKTGFIDESASCGEATPRPCACGNAMQNTYARLVHALGASEPVPQYGELGAACTTKWDCKSERCASDGTDQVCTVACDGHGNCPDGFSCVPSQGGDSLCWLSPSASAPAGGCDTGATPSLVAALTLLLMPRRRDRRASASTGTRFAG